MGMYICTNKNEISHGGPLTTYTLAQRLCVNKWLATKVRCGFVNEVWLPRRTYVRQTERTQKIETPPRGERVFKLCIVETWSLCGRGEGVFRFCI